MEVNQKTKIGIGFATGRKNFRKVLNSYIYGWKEATVENKENISLNLFVAYDLEYTNTQSTDYTNLNQNVVDALDEICFLGTKSIYKKLEQMIADGVIDSQDVKLLFGSGYAGKRNLILYAALESKMDYLLFLDDDEYPVAVSKNNDTVLWSGQSVIPLHLSNIGDAYITNGYHCGYISPIPAIEYNSDFTEQDFQRFVDVISNDIIKWDTVKKVIDRGGVTYANTDVLVKNASFEVAEEKSCKFITGANLCINLTDPALTLPFYNPPGARGEDTFLSTLLTDRKVLKIPCYTFHDGFSAYQHLLDGVLPIQLDSICGNEQIKPRFLAACIGWIRYKPLFLYITDREHYRQKIDEMKATLQEVLPKLARYFADDKFLTMLSQLEKYDRNVKKHYVHFQQTQAAWQRLINYSFTTKN